MITTPITRTVYLFKMDEKTLKEIIEQAKISHKYMLDSMRHNIDVLYGGNYSDDLKHAILVQELLDTIGNK